MCYNKIEAITLRKKQPAIHDSIHQKTPMTPLQIAVTEKRATEPPFANAYWNWFQKGIYLDLVTGQPLFSSLDKFDSGCGWPSFSKPLIPLLEIKDHSLGMIRTEVRNPEGTAHLGHVFDDGPEDLGGLRYCMNSAALEFVPIEKLEERGFGSYLALFQDDSSC